MVPSPEESYVLITYLHNILLPVMLWCSRIEWTLLIHAATPVPALGWSTLRNSWLSNLLLGLPRWLSCKESTWQWRRQRKRHVFDLWVGKIPWSRKWQPAPVFFSGEFHGRGSLVGYSHWGHRQSDTTEWLSSSNLLFFSYPLVLHRLQTPFITTEVGCHFLSFLNFYWSLADLQCHKAKWIHYTHTHIHFFRFFSHIGHYRELSRVPWAVQ